VGTLKVNVSVSVSGPLADGTAHDAVREWIDEAKKETADFAVRQLQAVGMDKTGRATGHYQSEIRTTLLTYNDLLISDPVIYGPWLEGTSKRNDSTRFKGYHLWRKAKQATQKEAPNIAERLLPKYIERMGGTP
jgi:hypothetical protein